MGTVPRPTYPSVSIPPGAGGDGDGGGGDGLSEAAVKALLAVRKTARTVSADFTLSTNDGIVSVTGSSAIEGTLSNLSTYGSGRAFIFSNRSTEALQLSASDGNVLNHEGAPGSPPGYTVAAGAVILLTTVSSSAWQVIYDSSLLGSGADGNGAPVPVDFIATEVGDESFTLARPDGGRDLVPWSAVPQAGVTVLVTNGSLLYTMDGEGGADSVTAEPGTYVATFSGFDGEYLGVGAVVAAGTDQAAIIAPGAKAGRVAAGTIFAASDHADFNDALAESQQFAAYIPPADYPGGGVTAIMVYDGYENFAGITFYRGIVKLARSTAVYTGAEEHDPYWDIVDDNILSVANVGGYVYADLNPGETTESPIVLHVSRDPLSGPAVVATALGLNPRQISKIADLIGADDSNPVRAAIDLLISNPQQPLYLRIAWLLDYQGAPFVTDGSKNPYPPTDSVIHTLSGGGGSGVNTDSEVGRVVLVFNSDDSSKDGFWLWNGNGEEMTRLSPSSPIGSESTTGASIIYSDLALRPVVFVHADSGTNPGQVLALDIPSDVTAHHLYRVVKDRPVGTPVFSTAGGAIPLNASVYTLYSHQGPHDVFFQEGHSISTTIYVEGYSNRHTIKDSVGRVLRHITAQSRPITFHPTGLNDGLGGEWWIIDDPNTDPDDLHVVFGYQGNTPLIASLSAVAPDTVEFVLDVTKMGYRDGVTLTLPGTDHTDQLGIASWQLDDNGGTDWTLPPSLLTTGHGKLLVGAEIDFGTISASSADLTVVASLEYYDSNIGQWISAEGSSIDYLMAPVAYNGTDLSGPISTKATIEVSENSRVTLALADPVPGADANGFRVLVLAYPTPGGTLGETAFVQVLRVKPLYVDYAMIRAAQIAAG